MTDRSTAVPPVTPRDRRARWAVTAYFVVSGVGLATWTARIPSIKQRLGLDDAQVSIALLAVAVGSVLAMQVVGALTDRIGSTSVLAPSGLLMTLGLAVVGWAGDLPTLLAGLVLFGTGHGALDVSMNVHAVRVEGRYQRPIMTTFHATFSAGGLLGATIGAVAAAASLNAGANLGLVGAGLAIASIAARPLLLPAEAPSQGAKAADRSSRGIPPAIVFLGVLAFFCALGEGSMADWSPLYLHDTLGTSAAVAPIGYATFSAAMAVFRFLGDGLVQRFGAVALVRGCGLVAGCGLGVALLLRHPVAAMVGFALFGTGLSCIIPQVFRAAGNRDPQRSGRDLAQVSTLGYGGLLTGPVVIGVVSHSFGLSVGLGVPAVLALFVALSAPAVHPGR